MKSSSSGWTASSPEQTGRLRFGQRFCLVVAGFAGKRDDSIGGRNADVGVTKSLSPINLAFTLAVMVLSVTTTPILSLFAFGTA